MYIFLCKPTWLSPFVSKHKVEQEADDTEDDPHCCQKVEDYYQPKLKGVNDFLWSAIRGYPVCSNTNLFLILHEHTHWTSVTPQKFMLEWYMYKYMHKFGCYTLLIMTMKKDLGLFDTMLLQFHVQSFLPGNIVPSASFSSYFNTKLAVLSTYPIRNSSIPAVWSACEMAVACWTWTWILHWHYNNSCMHWQSTIYKLNISEV